MKPLTITPIPKPSSFQIIIRWVLYACIALSIMVALVFLFWSLQSTTVLEIKNDRDGKGQVIGVPIRPATNKAGEFEILTVDYCKHQRASGTVVLRLVGQKSIIRIPWPDDKQDPRCLKADVPIAVPPYAVNDEYYFDFQINYSINPIKEQVVKFRSQSFRID